MNHQKLQIATSLNDLFLYAQYGFKAAYSYGAISNDAIIRIKNQTGLDLTGKQLYISTDFLRHVYGKYFQGNSRLSIKFNDLKNLIDVVNNFKLVEISNKKLNNKRLVFFGSSTPERNYTFITQLTKRGLSGVTFWITSYPANMPNDVSLSGTSKTYIGLTARKYNLNFINSQVLQ